TGKNTSGWGSRASPLLFKNTVVVNASVETGAMIAMDKLTGKEVWRTPDINSAWNTPLLVGTKALGRELVISIEGRMRGLDPDSGKELWNADGVHRYCCPSVVAHEDV